MSFLIDLNGERMWTSSAAQAAKWGEAGGTLVKQGAGAKPVDNADFIAGGWVADPARKAAVERKAKFMAMNREELVDFILDIINIGDTRLDKLEADVAALLAANAPIP